MVFRLTFVNRPASKYTETHIDVELPHRRRHEHKEVELEFTRPHINHSHVERSEIDLEINRPHYHHNKFVDIEIERPHHHHNKFLDVELERPHLHNKFVDIEVERPHHHRSKLDIVEAEYRSRFQPNYREEIFVEESTVDAPKPRKMGYYDDDVPETKAAVEPAYTKNTVSIPTHHIRMGDLLILQGRPCQVIRITTSPATGQHQYLGVDLFTKQLHEESSSISNPSPSVVVQTMLGPVFKQYRILDMQDGHVVAITETGDVKSSVPVIDQSNLWSRLKKSFESGRGSVRALVISDRGRELVVDMRVIHGSRL